MKKLWIWIVILFSMISIVSAADTTWDCDIILSKDSILSKRNEDNDNEVIKNIVEAMPKVTMEKAFENLQAYCCDTKKIDECNKTNDNKIYPESIYLFDHILDIYLRRLDAKQENDNGDDLLYNLEPDSDGKQWREFIINHANNVKWSLPLEINQEYKKTRAFSQNVTAYSNNYASAIDSRKSDIEYAIKNYENWTLRDKYNLACDVAKYINDISTGGVVIGASEITTQDYVNCKNLTDNRIKNETLYTKTVLMQKANVLLWSNMKAYLDTYFVNDKLSDLQKIIFDINTTLAEINKAVAKLTHLCN